MFGHNDDQGNDQNDVQSGGVAGSNTMPPVVPDPSVTAGLHDGSADPGPVTTPGAPAAPSVPSTPSVVEPTNETDDSVSNTDLDGKPESSDGTAGVLPVDNGGPSADDAQSDDSTDDTPTTADASASPADSELMGLKQDALQQLTPLVGHLDQTPEEKFRTTMMMIQASDDSSLVKTAFEAAQAITDDKVRAQALLDVINEINYFTQHKGDSEAS